MVSFPGNCPSVFQIVDLARNCFMFAANVVTFLVRLFVKIPSIDWDGVFGLEHGVLFLRLMENTYLLHFMIVPFFDVTVTDEPRL